MTVCLNNPVLGREITDNFTFDDTNNQIVPKPGTDTKPGALALNLGNNLPGDATNATDALTAAGFNAMANAVDSTAPLCGNEIQQAVTAAVAQSIGCDADAQEAIACAIASNPEAIACLAAALPSGCDDTGSLLLDAITTEGNTGVLWQDGVTTQLTVPAFAGGAGTADNGRYQNPGKFTGFKDVSGTGAVPYAFSPGANTYSLGGSAAIDQVVFGPVNHTGTRIAVWRAGTGKVHSIDSSGTGLIETAAFSGIPWLWLAEDLFVEGSNTRNATTGAAGTLNFQVQDPNRSAYAVSVDYSMISRTEVRFDPTIPGYAFNVSVRDLVRAGNNVTGSLRGAIVSNPVPLPNVLNTEIYTPTSVWATDGSHFVVVVSVSLPASPSPAPSRYPSVAFVVNVTPTGIVIDPHGVSVAGNTYGLNAPRMSGDGQFMTMNSVNGVAVFKRSGNRWRQIGTATGIIAATIVGGAHGYAHANSN